MHRMNHVLAALLASGLFIGSGAAFAQNTGATVTPVGDALWEDHGALVSFWVRTSRLPSRLDERLLAALRDWLAPYDRLGGVLFVTNEQVGQQVELLQRMGLELRFRIVKPTHDGAYLAYGF